MKTKARFHAETKELPGKPNRYAIIRQWTAGGATTHDDNNGEGFTLNEATQLTAQHNSLNRVCVPCQRRRS